MGSYPTSPRSDFLAWCQAHVAVFTDRAATIGLTPAQAARFKSVVTSATDRLSAQTEARIAAKTATSQATESFRELRDVTGETVRVIKTFAETSNNPAVYDLAQIPPPAPPTPLPPPAQPTDVTVSVDATTGAIQLAWKATNPRGSSGTSYIIRRKLPTQTSFEFVGVTGVKRFNDNSFIAGPDSVQYTIQGQRSDTSGPVSAILTINFGRAGGGGGAVAGAVAGAGGQLGTKGSPTDGYQFTVGGTPATKVEVRKAA
jgi:hypothetical protein